MASEAKLQSEIIKHLEANRWITIKTIQLSKNGFPDIMAFRGGKTIFIEVKSPTGKPTKLQEYRIEQLQIEGFKAFICNSIEQFKEEIK